MRVFSLILASLILLSPGAAWGVALSNFEFAPRSEAALQFDQHVQLTFAYAVDIPDGVRIYARPVTHGELTPHYAAHGSPVYPEGSGTGDGWFTIDSGPVTVDDVRFQVWTHDNSELLLEFYLPVRFHFGNHGIYNIEMTPPSPSCVMFEDQQIDITFDYITDHPGDVLIFARPYTGGGLTPNYFATGSPHYPSGSGSGDGSFGIHSGWEVTVDAIRFRMTNADQTEVLLEFSVPAAYEFKDGSVYNISMTPRSPHGLLHDEDVNIEFDYWTTDPGGVRIFARPFTNGSLTPHYAASGSPLYATGNGSGSGDFTILSEEVTVDEIKFRMTNADQSQVICEYFVPVNFHYAEHAIRDYILDHPSPAYFTYDHRAYMDVPYSTSWQPGVRIWALPQTDGGYTPGGFYGGSVVWPTGNGTAVDRYVGAASGPVIIDQLFLNMRDPDQTVDLVTWYVPVKLCYGDRPPSAVEDPVPPAEASSLFARFDSPLQVDTQITYALPAHSDVTLRVHDVTGRVVDSLVDQPQEAGEHSVTMPGVGIHSGVYFLRLEARDTSTGECRADGRRVVFLD